MPTGPLFSLDLTLDPDWIVPAYHHVHHGRALFLLELGRLALLESIGMPNEALMQRGQALVITKVAASYKREVKGESVTVTCDRAGLDGRALVVHQRILNEKGKEAVEAVIESVFMDTDTRRGIAPPDDFLRAYRSLAIFSE
jgi:YbgC/YbaW family acyl-CoA thioester hydrolase